MSLEKNGRKVQNAMNEELENRGLSLMDLADAAELTKRRHLHKSPASDHSHPRNMMAIKRFLFRDLMYHVFGEQLERFRNLHKGERCFVVGNGPSLNEIDMGLLADEITIGSNRVHLGFDTWGYNFTYWMIQDLTLIDQIDGEIRNLPDEMVKFIIADRFALYDELPNTYPFYVHHYENIGREFPQFSDDIRTFFEGWTVTYAMLQLAAYMGCDPIYLIGVDHSYTINSDDKKSNGKVWNDKEGKNHFVKGYTNADKGQVWAMPEIEKMTRAYACARDYFDHKGVDVVNLTPGTQLEIFRRAGFESAVHAGAKNSDDAGGLISVVVPVYNVEVYLKRCLDSVLDQTYPNLEVICVNDCSTDGSQAILKDYESKHDCIKVVEHDRNQGLGPARNSGIAVARGEFIGFVDSDDYIEPEMYARLHSHLRRKKADIVQCTARLVDEEGNPIKSYPNSNGRSMSDNHLTLFSDDDPRFTGAAWSKLYRVELFRSSGAQYPPHIFEDIPTTVKLLAKANTVVSVDEPLYNYVQRSGSIVDLGGFQKTSQFLQGLVDARNAVYHFLRTEGLDSEQFARQYARYLGGQIKKLYRHVNSGRFSRGELARMDARFLESWTQDQAACSYFHRDGVEALYVGWDGNRPDEKPKVLVIGAEPEEFAGLQYAMKSQYRIGWLGVLSGETASRHIGNTPVLSLPDQDHLAEMLSTFRCDAEAAGCEQRELMHRYVAACLTAYRPDWCVIFPNAERWRGAVKECAAVLGASCIDVAWDTDEGSAALATHLANEFRRLSSTAAAREKPSKLKAANANYREKRYGDALSLYRELESRGGIYSFVSVNRRICEARLNRES